MVVSALLVLNANQAYALVPSVFQTVTPPRQLVCTPMTASALTTRNANQPTATLPPASAPLLAPISPTLVSMRMDASAALMMNATPPIAHLKHACPYAPKTQPLGFMSMDVSAPQT